MTQHTLVVLRNHVTWSVDSIPSSVTYPGSLLSLSLDTVRKGINMRIFTSFFCVLLVVGGVSGVEKKKVTLSVMKGDNVTLNPDDAEIQTDDQILWRFKGSIITSIKKKGGQISTDDGPGGIFKEKLLPDKQTGSLTITDLTTDHTGMYQLEIRSTTEIFKNYSVTVSGGMKTESVKKGDSVILDTGLFEIKGYDLISWMSEGHVIAEMNRNTNQVLLFSAEGKFEGRLQRGHQTGSLIISDTRTTDSGDYQVNMSSSSHTLQRTITVTVTGLSVSEILLIVAGVVIVIVIVIVIVLLVIFIVMQIYKKRGAITNPSTTELPLNAQSANGGTD